MISLSGRDRSRGSEIHRVDTKILLRFQGKSLMFEGNSREI